MIEMTRRLLMTSAAATAVGGPAVRAATARLPRRATLSVNMRSDQQLVVPVPQTATYIATLPLETGATSLRIGIANTTPHRFQLGGVCLAETFHGAAGPAGWQYCSFSGQAGAAPRAPAGGPAMFTVPGDTGYFNVPVILWSDWMEFRTSAKRPQLTLRTLVPQQDIALMAFPAGPGGYGPASAGLPQRFAAQSMLVGDYVSDPNLALPPTANSKLSPVYVVQYRAATPGLQMVIGGDSHLAMSHTFAEIAANQLSTPAAPISVWNTAWAAKSSNTFWPALDQAIEDAPPSLTVIQGWTANDGMTPQGDGAYLRRVRESAARTFAAGGLPVIVKALPRDLYGKPELASWQAINQQLDTLVPGALVFDPGPYLYDPAKPGNYIAGLSDDGVHPNTQGNFALRDPFIRLIAPFLG